MISTWLSSLVFSVQGTLKTGRERSWCEEEEKKWQFVNSCFLERMSRGRGGIRGRGNDGKK